MIGQKQAGSSLTKVLSRSEKREELFQLYYFLLLVTGPVLIEFASCLLAGFVSSRRTALLLPW